MKSLKHQIGFAVFCLAVPTGLYAEGLTRAELVYSFLKLDSVETKLQRRTSKVDPEQAAKLYRQKAIRILESTFTPDELQHMIDYYGSDLGKSIRAKSAILGGALSEAIDEIHEELNPPPNTDDE